MKTRLNNEKDEKFNYDSINSDLNKIFKNQLSVDKSQNNLKNFISSYDFFFNKKQVNPYLINVVPVNYDFGFKSWLNVDFFTNKMKINVVDNYSKLKTVNNPEIVKQKDNLSSELIENVPEPPNNKTGIILLISTDQVWWRHLCAGAVAGVCSRTCTAPIDRIKVLSQVRGHEFPTILTCFRHIMEEGGISSLWRGNGINCLKVAPEIALRFMFYEQFKRYLKGDCDRQLAIYERFISGSFAGALSQSIIYPLEVLKTRLCLRKTGQYRGIFDAAFKIYKIEGYRTFYRGFYVNLAGIIPYSGIDLAVYETLKKLYLQNFQDKDPSFITVMACGVISNTSGQIFSYPLALVRTRLQAIDDKNVGFKSLTKQIYKNFGVRGFYKGFVPNFIKVAPANGITYLVYEKTREFLKIEMS